MQALCREHVRGILCGLKRTKRRRIALVELCLWQLGFLLHLLHLLEELLIIKLSLGHLRLKLIRLLSELWLSHKLRLLKRLLILLLHHLLHLEHLHLVLLHRLGLVETLQIWLESAFTRSVIRRNLLIIIAIKVQNRIKAAALRCGWC